MNKEEKHKIIQKNIQSEHSEQGVEIASRWLVKQGYVVYNRQFKEHAPKVEDVEKYSDVGDIITVSKANDKLVVVEVKRLTKENSFAYFKNADSFCHNGRNAVIVDGVHQVRNKLFNPSTYICLNYLCKTLFTVGWETKKFWTEGKAKGNEGEKNYYWCPVAHVKFYNVADLIPIELIKSITRNQMMMEI